MKLDILNKSEAVRTIRNLTEGYDGDIIYEAGVISRGDAETAFSNISRNGYLRAKGDDMEIPSMFKDNRTTLEISPRDYASELSDITDAEQSLRSQGYKPQTEIYFSVSSHEPAEAVENLEQAEASPAITLTGDHYDERFDTSIEHLTGEGAFEIEVEPTPFTTEEEAKDLETDVRAALAFFNL